MSLDTKYRPDGFGDVLGQESTIRILKRFVSSGKGRCQSYLFAGPWGSGKTTLGRILARALLCENPTPDGEPCDKCISCKSILELGTAMDFIEVDAATNSGKAEIQKITEEIQYDTFSGRKRLYLFDEAHQLSPSALDAMLKPLEENLPGSIDKKLVCIFCTTEPERMRPTIFSRCAPAFVIQAVAPEQIAERLIYVCKQEGIEADPSMLVTIAEMTECHIRDALKAIEGISMLGPINHENVISYLHLDQNDSFLDILDSVGSDLGKSLETAKQIMKKASPLTCYEKLAEISMLAYQVNLGFTKPPIYMNPERLKAIGKKHGDGLLGFATRFASRPGHPNSAMLLCDLGVLHHTGGNAPAEAMVVQVAAPMPQVAIPSAVAAPVPSSSPSPTMKPAPVGKVSGVSVEVNPRREAVNDGRNRDTVTVSTSDTGEMPPQEFARYLGLAIRERNKEGESWISGTV